MLTLSEYGVNWATILIVLPMILTLVVICIIETINEAQSICSSFVDFIYDFVTIPYAFMQRGGIQAFQQFMRFGDTFLWQT